MSEIEFFGFKFSEQGLSADPKKDEAVKSFTKPEDAKTLWYFIEWQHIDHVLSRIILLLQHLYANVEKHV